MNSPEFLNVSYVNSEGETKIFSNSSDTSLYDFSRPGTYTVYIGNDYSTEINLHLGGVYSLLVSPNSEENFVSSSFNI